MFIPHKLFYRKRKTLILTFLKTNNNLHSIKLNEEVASLLGQKTKQFKKSRKNGKNVVLICTKYLIKIDWKKSHRPEYTWLVAGILWYTDSLESTHHYVPTDNHIPFILKINYDSR